jgi:hypothetical protein
MARMQWDDFDEGQKAGLIVAMSTQVALAVSAWTDLAVRPAEEIRGSKAKWAAIIAVNYVGPILYFTRGRVRS